MGISVSVWLPRRLCVWVFYDYTETEALEKRSPKLNLRSFYLQLQLRRPHSEAKPTTAQPEATTHRPRVTQTVENHSFNLLIAVRVK